MFDLYSIMIIKLYPSEVDVAVTTQHEPFLFLLFDLILYVPVNNFSVMSGQVFLG